MDKQTPAATPEPIEPETSAAEYIAWLHEKIDRVHACHTTLLELSKTLPVMSRPATGGMVCHEFVFPELLNSTTDDINFISHYLSDLTDLLRDHHKIEVGS